MATHSSILAWKIPWMEEPGRLQSMGLCRVGHDWSNLAAAAAAGMGGKRSEYVEIFILYGQVLCKPKNSQKVKSINLKIKITTDYRCISFIQSRNPELLLYFRPC